jgi:hypothetical protein
MLLVRVQEVEVRILTIFLDLNTSRFVCMTAAAWPIRGADLRELWDYLRKNKSLWWFGFVLNNAKLKFGDGVRRGFTRIKGGSMARADIAREFVGEALKLNIQDFVEASNRLFCDVAAIRAVAEVESGGRDGFLADNRPKILFESRWFHNLTDGVYTREPHDISTVSWGEIILEGPMNTNG